jgi:hypothetical protein
VVVEAAMSDANELVGWLLKAVQDEAIEATL